MENQKKIHEEKTTAEEMLKEEAHTAEEADAFEEAESSEEKEQEEAAADPEVAALRDQFLRLQADFQNYRKRAERDQQDTVRYANERLIGELLEVVDNFERALATEKEQDAFFQGMEMIDQQIWAILKKNGVEEIPSDGAEFDPNLHNAVLSEESDTVKSGYVIETMVKGYTLHGRMIRPAMVKVAR